MRETTFRTKKVLVELRPSSCRWQQRLRVAAENIFRLSQEMVYSMNVQLTLAPASLRIFPMLSIVPNLILQKYCPVVFEQTCADLLELALMKRDALLAQIMRIGSVCTGRWCMSRAPVRIGLFKAARFDTYQLYPSFLSVSKTSPDCTRFGKLLLFMAVRENFTDRY